MEHSIESITDIKNFIFAGNATVTIKSKISQEHITFKIKQKKNSPFFVSVLSGSDNENDYRYLGCVYDNKNYKVYKHGVKSKISKSAKSNKIISWFVDSLNKNSVKLLEQAEIYHEGRCGRCGRKLTHPQSIIDGIGPECKKRLK